MPTTCGFPNCKFRSRYRGSDDNRHFYRVPKKPAVLRERWLEAIGRTEQTIVSQLRVCSGHFHDGEKKEGDVPVADPSIDSPIKVELPPRSNKASAERRAKRAKLAVEKQRGSAESPQSSNSSSACVRDLLNSSPAADSCRAAAAAVAPAINAAATTASIASAAPAAMSASGPKAATSPPASSPTLTPTPTPAPTLIANPIATNPIVAHHHQRPLVALLDGRDCSVEMPLLKDHATVAFCDAQTVSEVHEKVLNEAVAALMWSSIHLGREELAQFRQLKLLVQIGPGSENIDLAAARSLGISVSCISGACVEETADSTICLILSLYRKTIFLANNYAKDSNGAISIDRMSELASGATRIRGQTLGLVGFGRVGTAVAIRARAFGFQIMVYDPNLAEGVESSFGVGRAASVEELVASSDCVSLHCPDLPGTRGLLGQQAIRCAKKSGFFLVNTCSAALMDEAAVADALRDGVIRGLALDLPNRCSIDFENGVLKDCPNVVATPGSAFYSDQACAELRELAAEEIRRGLAGRVPDSLKFCVNPEPPAVIACPAKRPRVAGPTRPMSATSTGAPTAVGVDNFGSGASTGGGEFLHQAAKRAAAVAAATAAAAAAASSAGPGSACAPSKAPHNFGVPPIRLNFGYVDSFPQSSLASLMLPGASFDPMHAAAALSSVAPLHYDSFGKKDILI